MWAPIAAAVGKTLAGKPRGLNIGSSTRGQLQGLRAGPKPIKGGGFGLVAAVLAQRKAQARAQQQNEAAERQHEYDNRKFNMRIDQLRNDQLSNVRDYRQSQRQQSMGPQQDWLSDLYSSHNIGDGKLDQEARDYWSNEAKTKGRDAVMQSIIGTSKAQGTYGGRKKPQRINTGPKRKGGGGPMGIGLGLGILGGIR